MLTRAHLKPTLYFCLTALLGLLFSGCGFYLRGTQAQSDFSFRSIFIDLPATSSLGNILQKSIRSNHKTLIALEKTKADVVLHVISESKQKTVLSLNSQGRVREYILYYTFKFRLINQQDDELLEPTEITLNRIINYSDAQVLARESEENLLYRDMQVDIVQRVMQYLAKASCCKHE